MTRVSDTARIKVEGVLSHVTHSSPLEDQVQVVYQAAHRYALANRFKQHVHNGPQGSVPGLAGPMVMKKLIRQLFPEMDEDGANYGLISQVLRKTDAAVCIKRPKPNQQTQQGNMPVWFIADSMPENLVIIALNIRKRSAGVGSLPADFDENAYLTKREKYKVTPEEAGETQTPGEVTVSQKEAAEAETVRQDRFGEARERRMAEHRRLLQRVLDELATTPIALAGDELAAIINRDPDFDLHESTYAQALRKLVDQGTVVKRKEEDSERLLRGGGLMPKGGRKWLHALAPEPVALRESLPPGIDPRRPAIEWAEERKAEWAEDREKVLRALHQKGGRMANPPRSIGVIAAAAGLDKNRTQLILDRLVAEGVLYKNASSCYFLESKRRFPKQLPEQPPAPANDEPEVFTAEPTPNIVQPSSPVVPDPDDSIAFVLSLAERLGVTLPKGDEERIAAVEAQLHESNQAMADVLKENERLRKQVTALKAAIATME